MSSVYRKCAKCHKTNEGDNSNLRLHRFPLPGKHGPLRARVWAEFCYPTGNWSTEESLKSLHCQHKLLCSEHFEDNAYTSSCRTRLNAFAIPIGTESIMLRLREEESSKKTSTHIPATIQSLDNLVQLEKLEDNSYVMMSSYCRVCLNYSNQLNIIANTQLQILFENLTNSQLIASDGRPESVCYLCHSLLQRCNKFVQASQKSNEFLSKLLRNESEDKLTEDILVKTPIHIEAPFNLAISKVSHVSISVEKEMKKSNIYLVKTEPAEGRDIESTKVHNMNVTTNKYKVKLTEQNPDDADRPNKEIESLSYRPERESKTEENCNVSDDASEDNSVNKSKIVILGEVCKEKILEEDFEKNNQHEHKTQTVQHKTVEIGLQQLNVKQKPIHKKSLRLKLAGNPERSTLGYQCEYCLRHIKRKAYFKRHIRIHTGECPYTCNKCEESFRDSIALKQHVRNHTCKARYCHFCFKQFDQRPKLKEHIRTHTGEKPLKCPKCPNSFAHRSSLVRHLITHTGEKPFICDKCPKRFIQISDLTKHAKSHKVHASCPQSQQVQVAENTSTGETPSNKSALGFNVPLPILDAKKYDGFIKTTSVIDLPVTSFR